MFKRVKNIRVNYKQYGEGKDIVLLHGWGQNIQMMEPLGNNFCNRFRITIVDLPGFGLSEEPDFAYTVYDYVELLKDLFNELNIKNPILMGHSFGGRLSIIYSSKYDVDKIVLFGSPCVRHEYKSKKQSLFKALKKAKVFSPIVKYMKNHTGSVDYRNASPMMKDVLVKTVNEDLSECAKKIKCPSLLIWGDKDVAVPLNEANELKAKFEEAGATIEIK